MAAKDSDTEPACRRSAFLTACIARFTLAAFFFLLELVPCRRIIPQSAAFT